jgi:hypothetical protein
MGKIQAAGVDRDRAHLSHLNHARTLPLSESDAQTELSGFVRRRFCEAWN